MITLRHVRQIQVLYNARRLYYSSSVDCGTRWEQLETEQYDFNVTNMTGRYEQAIVALNGLQTNHAILDKVIKERQKNVHLNIPLTKKFLEVSGVTLQELDQLKVIHVSGTKGKGKNYAYASNRLNHFCCFIIKLKRPL